MSGGMRLRNRLRYGSVTWRSVTQGWPIQSTLGNQVSSTRTNSSSRYSLMNDATADVIKGSVDVAELTAANMGTTVLPSLRRVVSK
jgi:hypothetical protein